MILMTMTRTTRRCLDCRRLTSTGSRCPPCRGKRKAVRNADREIAKAVIAAAPWCHCSGCRVCEGSPCSRTDDLTAEHVTPVGRSGVNTGRRMVLCRRCNSSRRDRGGYDYD